MKYPYISGVNYESVADGRGIRTAVFLSGCEHNCPGCHNPQTHNPHYGEITDDASIKAIARQIKERTYIDGITLTGGDPLYDVPATTRFLTALKEQLSDRWEDLDVWLYTGFTWEHLMQRYSDDVYLQDLLDMTDIVVDGPFVKQLADPSLAFRGSSNQHIVDVKRSLKANDVIYYI